MAGKNIEGLKRAIKSLSARINRPLKLMEVCGTHTVAIFRHGIRGLLPEDIGLLSGPGCPVCVTPEEDVDCAIEISMTPGAVLATFGDMMRVPGRPSGRSGTDASNNSLNSARAEGANVSLVYSPLDALKLARENKDKRTVFFATGFETTSPLVAATLLEAENEGVENFYIYPAHKLVPPALRALLDSPDVKLDGLILPGHVSAIIGSLPYGFLASEYRVPSVITGFEAEDILEGILMLLKQIDSGSPSVQIQYGRIVRKEGNPKAVSVMEKCFEASDSHWRGIGVIPGSGLELKAKYKHRDAKGVLGLKSRSKSDAIAKDGHALCACGEVLRGIKLPTGCPLFGKRCTPERPVGACMVSTEGSCAAYYKYGGGGNG